MALTSAFMVGGGAFAPVDGHGRGGRRGPPPAFHDLYLCENRI